MAILENLKESVIKIPLQSMDKDSVLGELLNILDAQGILGDYSMILQALKKREALSSTGLDRGIAIPHAKTDLVTHIAVALGIAPHGIDFNALDGNPSRIFFLILAPPEQASSHVMALSEIAKLSQKEGFFDSLLKASTPKDVLELFPEPME